MADSSGSSHTGTFVNTPTWTATGRVNGALTFGGTNAAVTVPGSGNIADLYTTGMSVSVWIKPTSAGGGSKGRILDKTNWMLRMGSATTLEFIADEWTTTFAQRTSSASIVLNAWQHVVATWTGSQTGTNIHLYINGVLRDGASINGAGTATSDASSALGIGNNVPSVNRGFAGSIDEVRIYNRVLTTTEIQALADSTVPSAPGSPAATAASSTQINLSWSASTDNVAVTGYKVERCTGASCTTFTEVATPTASPFNNTGLTAATTYRYRIRATDANMNLSAYSSIVNATTPAGGGDTQAPTAPSALSATPASSTQINLSWRASTDNVGVTGYLVERCQGAGCSSFNQIATPTGTTFSDTGLADSTAYSYRVRAKDAAGNLSAYSATASATTSADIQPPTVPGGLTVVNGTSTEIDLTWTASIDDVGVTGYLLERCQGGGCTSFSQIAAPSGPSYNDIGLVADTAYSYRVRAKDAANNLSGYSGVLSIVTPVGTGMCHP